MRQTTRNLKNSKRESFSVYYFYEKYIQKKGKFYPHEIDLNQKKISNKPKKLLSRKLFALIIMEYLKIYFYDLVYNSRDSYFFLGGRMTVATLSAKLRPARIHLNPKNVRDNLVFIWYRRPSKRDYYMLKLTKLKGSYSKIRKLEEDVREKNMLDLFPNFRKAKYNFKNNKQLFKCIQN